MVLAYALGLALLIIPILWLNEGHFSYSLDDPYIHLALAENLAHGHYGIDPAEPSSPSSSILWPVLLAPFARFGFFEIVPLIIGVLSIVGALLVLWKGLGPRLASRLSPGAVAVTVFLVALGCNFWGLPLLGMEHSLQILLAAVVACGLIDLVESDRASGPFLAALVLGPLVRYESLSFLVMGAVVLWMTRHRVKAVLVFVLGAAPVVVFSGFLYSLGLPGLPSSVLAKSATAAADGLAMALFEIAEHVLEGVSKDRWLILGTMLLLLGRRVRRDARPERTAKDRLYFIFLAGTLAAHLVAGGYNWSGRYEGYLLLAFLVVLLFAFRDALADLIARRRRIAIVGLIAAALVVGRAQIVATLAAPIQANQVYVVSFQIHRFVVDFWRDKSAATDLGRLALRNPHYVLDLWGLGSEPARLGRQSDQGNGWADRLAALHDVDLLIVNEEWLTPLGPLPPTWKRVARLGFKPAGDRGMQHTFFLRDPNRQAELLWDVHSFRSTLPARSDLKLVGELDLRASTTPGPAGPS